MTTTQAVEITVSKPYHVTGFQGSGHYGTSNWTRRDYTANVLGRRFANTSKATIQQVIRAAVYRETGARATFTFTDA